MKAARHVLRYLNGTKHYSITYGGATPTSMINFIGYADASHGGDWDDGKSTYGYVFMINNGPVTWASHKQSSVAISTTEAEYMALSEASREAIARTYLFNDLNVHYNTPAILSDSQGALTISNNPTEHQRAKHIAIRYHHIRNLLQNKQIALGYIPGPQQIADIFTKALHSTLHHRFVLALGLT
jgi:hypothetical protein